MTLHFTLDSCDCLGDVERLQEANFTHVGFVPVDRAMRARQLVGIVHFACTPPDLNSLPRALGREVPLSTLKFRAYAGPSAQEGESK